MWDPQELSSSQPRPKCPLLLAGFRSAFKIDGKQSAGAWADISLPGLFLGFQVKFDVFIVQGKSLKVKEFKVRALRELSLSLTLGDLLFPSQAQTNNKNRYYRVSLSPLLTG